MCPPPPPLGPGRPQNSLGLIGLIQCVIKSLDDVGQYEVQWRMHNLSENKDEQTNSRTIADKIYDTSVYRVFLKKGKPKFKGQLFQGYNIYSCKLCTRIRSNSSALI